jgi:hypothetical protein
MKNLRGFCVAALLCLASTGWAGAKGLGGPIRGLVMFRDVAEVVRAHVAPDGNAAIIVDESYVGPDKAGDRVPVEKEALSELTVPGGVTQPEMFLVLERAPDGDDLSTYGPYLFSKARRLRIDDYLCRRISDGRIYFWYANTKTASYRYWSPFTNTAALTRDESHPDLAALETDLREGITRHIEWWRAKKTTDPAEKLDLLRPFLLPGGPHHLNAYEVWSCTSEALEEAEKAGPASVPFFEELLTEPSLQAGYSPDGWLGIGAQERAAVTKSLQLVEARLETNPQKRLEKLRPVFEVPSYEFRAGTYPSGMVQQYLDRALAVAASVDAVEARPFLQGLLALPQFQKGFEPIGQTSEGEEMRGKIEAVLAGLK